MLRTAALAALGRGVAMGAEGTRGAEDSVSPFRFCLNSGTIRGQKLGVMGELETAAQAGYDSIEPWVRDLVELEEQGGRVEEFRKRMEDLGLTMESAIAFPRWIVEDNTERSKGMEEAKIAMDVVARAGGVRLACPPAGATEGPVLDLLVVAERYRDLLELGDRMEVVPQLEVWGFSRNLYRLGQAMCVAVEAGHPKSCILPDIYHLYRGGSRFEGLRLLSSKSIHVFHVNDYPAEPAREELTDAHRVFPGDGVAPINDILDGLRGPESTVVLSLELFNQAYWQQDALDVARKGLSKMKACVAAL